MQIYELLKKTFVKNRVLFKNFSSLSILQVSQYLFPLITFPYLVRVLGPEGYGLVAFAGAFVSYFTIITEYGFNYSATKKIANSKEDHKTIQEIFNNVFSTRLFLFSICTIIIVILVLSIDKLYDDYDIYFVSYLFVFGLVIFPSWFFEGIQRMQYITIIKLSIKFLWVLSIFFLIKGKDDIIILVLLNSLDSILVGIFSLIIINKKFNIHFSLVPFSNILDQLKNGWYYFLSNISTNIYSYSSIFVLGLVSNNSNVGYFSVAEKISYIFRNMYFAASKALYPHISYNIIKAKTETLKFLQRYLVFMGLIALLLSITLFLFSEQIVYLVLGEKYHSSIIILKVLSFLPLVVLFHNVIGIQTMLTLGFKKQYAKIVLTVALFHLIFSIIFIPMYEQLASAVIMILSEVLAVSWMYKVLVNKNYNIFSSKFNEGN